MRQVTEYDQVSYDDYLRIEEEAIDVRYEYVDGFLYAMVGATRWHNSIVGNIASVLRASARGSGCWVYAENVKLRAAERVVYYPDLVVTCDPSDDDPIIVQRPCLIIEVTSPSTRTIDQREKRGAYRRIPTLLSYMIVYQEERRVERHWRDSVSGVWQTEIHIGGEIRVPCPDVMLSLDDIYAGMPASSG